MFGMASRFTVALAPLRMLGEEVAAARPAPLGLVDVYAAVIPGFSYQPAVHVN